MIIGKIFGIRLRLNGFFLLLLVLMSIVKLLPETLILFAIVLVHELAHGAAARGFGLKVEEVELLPFGGVARIDDIMEVDPTVETTVALVGPITNLFLVGLGFLTKDALGLTPTQMEFFIRSNLVLAVFNMVPALPLDGGRVYRAYLSRRMGFRKATERAAKVSKVFAILFAVGGAVCLYFRMVNISLVVVSFFVFFAADRERGIAPYIFMRYLTGKKEELRDLGVLPAEQVVASSSVPIKELVRNFGPKRYHVVLVVDEEGNLDSITTEGEIIDSFFEDGINTPVGDVAGHRF